MMVSGITLYNERPPAVAVHPLIQAPAIYLPFQTDVLQSVSPSAATLLRQHPDRFDRTRQDSYDLHGRIVHRGQSTGTRFDTFI